MGAAQSFSKRKWNIFSVGVILDSSLHRCSISPGSHLLLDGVLSSALSRYESAPHNCLISLFLSKVIGNRESKTLPAAHRIVCMQNCTCSAALYSVFYHDNDNIIVLCPDGYIDLLYSTFAVTPHFIFSVIQCFNPSVCFNGCFLLRMLQLPLIKIQLISPSPGRQWCWRCVSCGDMWHGVTWFASCWPVTITHTYITTDFNIAKHLWNKTDQILGKLEYLPPLSSALLLPRWGFRWTTNKFHSYLNVLRK